MLRIAICDDEKLFVNELHTQIREFFLDKRLEFRVTEYMSGKELMEHAGDNDLIFLDVKMPDQDGFKTAEILREKGFAGSLIFVTIMRDDVYKAFEYEAFDYLVKPLSQASFEHTMRRFLHSLNAGGKQLMVAQKNELQIIRLSDILYCEVINRKINLHLLDGSTVEYYGKISVLEQRLSADFFKSHRSYLVNLKHITGYNSNEITLAGGERLPLSRGRRNALMDALITDIDNVDEVR